MKDRRIHFLFLFTLPTLLLFLFHFVAGARSAPGVTLTVNSGDDSVDGSGCDATHCSLREALIAANTAGSGSIYLDPPGDLILPLAPLPPVTGELYLYGQNTTLHGGDASPLLAVAAGGNLYADNLVLRNAFGMQGAALYNAGRISILNSAFLSNTANVRGGAVYNEGIAFLRYSLFQGNEAVASGGAVENRGLLTVERSTLAGNAAGAGGAIFANGPTTALTLTNSTVSGNTATAGGGVMVRGARAYLHSNTLYANENKGSVYAAGLMVESLGGEIARLHLENTIIAGSSYGPECSLAGTLLANRYNLIADGTCLGGPAPGFLTGDPALLPLAQNGGVGTPLGSLPTPALAADSPVRDQGTPATCPALDQRGALRPQDGDEDGSQGCDIGAFEAVYLVPHAALNAAGELLLSWQSAGDWAYELYCAENDLAAFAPCTQENPVVDNSLAPSSVRPAGETNLDDPARNILYRVLPVTYGGTSGTAGAFTFALTPGG